MTLLTTLQKRRPEVLDAAARHGAVNVRIFGSVGRGEDQPDSDVDLIVDFPSGCSFFQLGALQIELEKLFGRSVDLLTPGEIHPKLKNEILAEARPL